jgi:hypothetical protein
MSIKLNMKKNLLIKLFVIAFVVPFVTSCNEDSDPIAPPPSVDKPPATLSSVDFIPANAIVKENNLEGYFLQMQLSKVLTSAGEVVVDVKGSDAVYGQHFITEPAFTNGRLLLPVAPDIAIISFKVIPIDNPIITGEREIEFNISETSPNITKGSTLKESFKIYDDELTNKPKGYEIGAGSWGLRKTREYDSLGRISKVNTETATPATTSRTETYYYNPAGQLEKINLYPGIDQVFTWENNRIIKSEKINHGVLKSYIEYTYDEYGNISAMVSYYLQDGGQYAVGGQFAYLYYEDGNVYKSFSFAPAKEGEEPILLETRTYEGYIDAANPFPMVDILPTVQTQTKLPSIYRLERDGIELVYDLSYEFGESGLLEKRTATSAQASEVAVYSYY